MRVKCIFVALFVVAGSSVAATEPGHQRLTLHGLFGDHMVLQRDMKVPVWGTSVPGDGVTVEFAGQVKRTHADQDGRWRVVLNPMPASAEPHRLVVKSSLDPRGILVEDVLIGDVWIGLGQSNMEWTLSWMTDSRKELARATNALIRCIMQRSPAALSSRKDITPAQWIVSAPEPLWNFTAVGYIFGEELQEKMKIPVGIIQATVGGTLAEGWTDFEALKSDPELAGCLAAFPSNATEVARIEKEIKDVVAERASRNLKDPGITVKALKWSESNLDTSEWKSIVLPSLIDAVGPEMNVDGAFWFRKEIEIPADWQGKPLALSLGAIDDTDITFFNGVQVGSIDATRPYFWLLPREYEIPGGLVQTGRVALVVRVFDCFGQSGFNGPAADMFIAPKNGREKAVSLAGEWKYRIEFTVPPRPGPPPTKAWSLPTVLYNGVVAPLMPFAVKGLLWYQGESNTHTAHAYRKLLPAMIKGWRKNWGYGDLPFLIVQLPNFGAKSADPNAGSKWAELREAQALALSEPATAMAVIIDLGTADVHPGNKRDVAERLFSVAEKCVYGKKDTVTSPVFDAMTVKDGKVLITFREVGSGLVAKDGKPVRGFAVAEKDGKFVWADAEIVKGAPAASVRVWSDKVKNPSAVRFMWADNPDCNLYNQEGWPAAPFRTDDRPGITAGK